MGFCCLHSLVGGAIWAVLRTSKGFIILGSCPNLAHSSCQKKKRASIELIRHMIAEFYNS